MAQSLLCKTETASSSFSILASDWNLIANNTTQTRTTSYTFTQSMDTVYLSASWSWYSDYAANYSGYVKMYHNSTLLYSWSWSSRSESMRHMESLSVANGDTVSIVVQVAQWSWDRYSSSFTWTVQISWWNNAWMIRPLIPQKIEEILSQGKATSYWRLDDGTWYGDFYESTSATATTGNISPWNFVGYLTVSDKNWTKYKIPYYWL